MTLDLLPFVTAARWYAGKGRDAEITAHRRLGWLTDPAAEPSVALDVVEVSFADGEEPHLYQLPLAHYTEAQERLTHAFIGVVDDPDAGRRHIYDAPHDREAMAVYQRAFAEAALPDDEGMAATAIGHVEFRRLPGHELDLDAHSTMFAGEQSNTSVMYGEDAVLKLFRRLTPGINPDIEIHTALTRAESTHIAGLYGWVQTGRPVGAGPGDAADQDVLQLALLQQFLRTAADGWDLAQASVRNLFAEADLHAEEVGGDFAGEAKRLGIALREVHQDLHARFPADDVIDLRAVTRRMNERLDVALGDVPELDELADGLRAVFAEAADLGDYPVQRIHGDLHLGQTLRTVAGWKLVDFEGEPAKPLAERRGPDVRWRDVAGMLRSIDYAARTSLLTAAEPDDERFGQLAYRAREWAHRNQEAFLAAYAEDSLDPREQVVLRAYIADKAVYEAVYEVRHRPTWVRIPVAAIAALIGPDPGPGLPEEVADPS